MWQLTILLVAVLAVGSSSGAGDCWKYARMRYGSAPSECPENSVMLDGRCHRNCQPGLEHENSYYWYCMRPCPEFTTRNGDGECVKPAPYLVGDGYGSETVCLQRHYQGCNECSGKFYPKCEIGFTLNSKCSCQLVCPSSFKDYDTYCYSTRYSTTNVDKVCKPGMEFSAAEVKCYNACPSDFYGYSAACYEKCPQSMYDCGTECVFHQSSCTTDKLLRTANYTLALEKELRTNPTPTREEQSLMMTKLYPNLNQPVCAEPTKRR